jgi:hypothetical protein
MQIGQARRRVLRHLTYRIVDFAVGDFHVYYYLNDAERKCTRENMHAYLHGRQLGEGP